jgi:hypothetical protein
MSTLDNPFWRDLKPDAQAFDEIRITTVPRYKTSYLSGDEWRISAKIEFYRKGELILERYMSNIETACYHLGSTYSEACNNGNGLFAGEGNFCDQEGCKESATVTYKKKFDYCRLGHKHEITTPTAKIRKFCARHSTRGNCGLDDADANYELLEGQSSAPNPKDESPSNFAGVVVVDLPPKSEG